MTGRIRRILILVSVLPAAAVAACAGGPLPCRGPAECGTAREHCSAGRCIAPGMDPATAAPLRLRTSSRVLAVVSESSPAPRAATAITLGSRGGGASDVYLKFDPIWRDLRRIDAAFVVLSPLPGTGGGTDDIAVDAWRILEEWSSDRIDWLSKPDLGDPHSAAIACSRPPLPLRVDVTEWVRYAWMHPRSDHGIALTAPPGPGPGSSYATGLGVGAAPRLEVYGE